MTEPELIEVLVGRFRMDRANLNGIGGAQFPKKLFKELLDARRAHALLVDIFNRSIIGEKALCEAEKAIIREVKSWEQKSPELSHMCKCFFESDLEPTK